MITTTIKSIQDIMRQDTGVDGDAQRLSQPRSPSAEASSR
jgi:type I restriction enzyme M protein